MNFKLFIAVLIVSISCTTIQAQKIKIKKNIISIDDEEVYSIRKKGSSSVISHLYGEEFVLLEEVTFLAPNPALETAQNPKKVSPKVIEQAYIDVTFLYLDLEFETELTFDHLLMVINDCKIHDHEGNMIKENALRLAASISKNVSGNSPSISYTRR